MSYVDQQSAFYRNVINRADDATPSELTKPLPNGLKNASHPIRVLSGLSYISLHRRFGGVSETIPRGMVKMFKQGNSPLEVATSYLSRTPLIAHTLMEDGQKTFKTMFDASVTIMHFHKFLLDGALIVSDKGNVTQCTSFYKPLVTEVEFDFNGRVTPIDGYYFYKGKDQFLIVLSGKALTTAQTVTSLFNHGNLNKFPIKDELDAINGYIQNDLIELKCISLESEFIKRPNINEVIKAVMN